VRCHLAFMQGKLDGPEMIDDIEFYSVGRNSSHYFYLGLKGTQVYYRTAGFTVGDELEDTYRPVDTLSGLYLGHY
jgi:hypothetical protein